MRELGVELQFQLRDYRDLDTSVGGHGGGGLDYVFVVLRDRVVILRCWATSIVNTASKQAGFSLKLRFWAAEPATSWKDKTAE